MSGSLAADDVGARTLAKVRRRWAAAPSPSVPSAAGPPKRYRIGTRARQLLGRFGTVKPGVPLAGRATEDGAGTRECRCEALPHHARRTR